MDSTPRPVEGVRSTAIYILSNVGRLFRRPRPAHGQVIVVLEGKHDVEFFRRISGILHAETAEVPDLRPLEYRGQVVFLPCGGFDRHQWPLRLAPLGCREFHLFDRDLPQDADARCQAAAVVNLRPGDPGGGRCGGPAYGRGRCARPCGPGVLRAVDARHALGSDSRPGTPTVPESRQAVAQHAGRRSHDGRASGRT